MTHEQVEETANASNHLQSIFLDDLLLIDNPRHDVSVFVTSDMMPSLNLLEDNYYNNILR